MTRPDSQDQEFPRSQKERTSPGDVRATPASDVVRVLAVGTSTTSGDPSGSSPDDRFSSGLSSSALEDRQVLLHAAIRDLNVMDVRLYHARH
ncbi:hypothetical protein RCH21_000748 [Arthrobacter sp. PL16]|nr:hypothetical protein [Arthrobacter sp. PL16]